MSATRRCKNELREWLDEQAVPGERTDLEWCLMLMLDVALDGMWGAYTIWDAPLGVDFIKMRDEIKDLKNKQEMRALK